MILVIKNEAVAARRRAYFQCVDVADGMTPELGEVGGQPEISIDGAAWTSAGAVIGVLVVIGNGRYYATLSQAVVNLDDAIIQTRYKSANTAESIGTTVQVVKQLADILADTNELQTDDYPTSIAAIKAETALIVSDTNELQTNQGAWATAVGFSTLDAAEVRTSVGMAAADLDTQLAAIAADASGLTGAGSITCNVYTKSGVGAPIDGVDVWVTSDAAGDNLTAGTIASDDLGLTTFYLDVGTYYLWRQLVGYTFTNPQTITVTT